MRLWLIRHGETQANVDGLYSGHAPPPPPLTARGIEQAQNLHTLLDDVSFDLVLCSELERAQHTARLVLSDRQASSPFISSLNSTKCFLATGRCDIIATSCKKMPKTIARGAMTGSMLSPRTVKDFRHFRNVWNALSQGLVNISTIRIF